MDNCLRIASALSLFVAIGAIAPASSAQPDTTVVVLNTALYNKDANQRESTDSSRAVLATHELRARFAADMGSAVIDPARVDAAAASPLADSAAAGKPCNVIVACARAVAQSLGARWVVMSKVSKTSNLIWLLSGQLIDARTGAIVIDDSTELKGDPGVMVPAGVKLFADRVTKRIRHGPPPKGTLGA
jgi:hypothetical protein